METAAKVKRIGELMVRKDEIELERDKFDEQRSALIDEYDRIDDELVTLMGVKPANQPNGDRKQMKCGVCGEYGHNSKRHQKETA